jgi:UDP-glucose 4-epimerase
MIFNSSAIVYTLQATNPYWKTKLMIEDILNDTYEGDNEWNICILDILIR